MKIKEKFNEISVDSFIFDYVKACGVEDAERYLSPTWDDRENPCDYDNMKEAYECLCLHHVNGDSAGILQDEDGDGCFSASLMYNYLIDIEYSGRIIPFFHKEKAHGLTDKEVLERIKSSGIKLLIVPDAGSSDYAQHKELKEMGIDVIILDHHEANTYSEHAIVINNQLSKNVANKHGSGTLVTCKFCEYIDMMTGFDFAENYYDYVAFSLLTDVCSITSYENNFYLRYGLQNIKAPLLLSLIKEKLKDEISPTSISWQVNPCLNSAIRHGLNSDLFMALTNPDTTVMWQRIKKEEEKEWNIVDKVVTESKATQSKQSREVTKYMEQLSKQVNDEDKVIITIVDDSFPRAYSGLVASKLESAFGKPSLVLFENDKSYSGSVRSQIDIRDTFNNSKLFIYNSGHSNVFGTSFYKNKLDDIKEFFNSLDMTTEKVCSVAKAYKPSSIPKELFEVVDANSALWSKGMDCPLFAFTNIKINSDDIQVMGKTGTTFKFMVDGITFIKFFANAKVKEKFMIGMSKKLDITVIGKLSVNVWREYRTPQVIIEDYEVGEEKKRILDWDDIF